MGNWQLGNFNWQLQLSNWQLGNNNWATWTIIDCERWHPSMCHMTHLILPNFVTVLLVSLVTESLPTKYTLIALSR